MRRNARIVMAVLLVAGLWLALKPTYEHRRITFLPVVWSQYLDLMDFWFNLAAFTLLSTTAWLALSPSSRLLRFAAWMVGAITLGNVLVELIQTRIPVVSWTWLTSSPER